MMSTDSDRLDSNNDIIPRSGDSNDSIGSGAIKNNGRTTFQIGTACANLMSSSLTIMLLASYDVVAF
jgi:hypothetical protein